MPLRQKLQGFGDGWWTNPVNVTDKWVFLLLLLLLLLLILLLFLLLLLLLFFLFLFLVVALVAVVAVVAVVVVVVVLTIYTSIYVYTCVYRRTFSAHEPTDVPHWSWSHPSLWWQESDDPVVPDEQQPCRGLSRRWNCGLSKWRFPKPWGGTPQIIQVIRPF